MTEDSEDSQPVKETGTARRRASPPEEVARCGLFLLCSLDEEMGKVRESER